MRDFPWGVTRSFKPLHKICNFDFDVRRAHPRRTPSQSRTVPRYPPPIRCYAMPTDPAQRASNSELAVTSAVREVPSSSEHEINFVGLDCLCYEAVQYKA